MAGTAENSNVRRSHPAPSGKMVKFFLKPMVRGTALPPGEQYLPVGINGFNYKLKFGDWNEVPEEVVQVIQDSQSRTKVPDLAKAVKDPRPMGQIRSVPDEQSRYEYIQDYEITVT